jgi:hypothetical protein
VFPSEVPEIATRLQIGSEELLPCVFGDKKPLIRGWADPGWRMDWKKFECPPRINIGTILGLSLMALDIDDPSALVLDSSLSQTAEVATSRGYQRIFFASAPWWHITSKGVLPITMGGRPVGEVRLGRCYSVVHGVHPSGRRYRWNNELHPRGMLPLDLIEGVRMSGGDVLVPPPRGPAVERRWQADRDWILAQARTWAENAPTRDDGTIGTDEFRFWLIQACRTQPDELLEIGIAAFSSAASARALTIRDGSERLLAECVSDLRGWRGRYQSKAWTHYLEAGAAQDVQQDVTSYCTQRRLPKCKPIHAGQAKKVLSAILVWCRERKTQDFFLATKAFEPRIDRRDTSRALSLLTRGGILERRPYDGPIPKGRPAVRWSYTLVPLDSLSRVGAKSTTRPQVPR